MTDKDLEFAKKVTAYLDQGAAGIKAGTAYQLSQARAAALARLAEGRTAEEPALQPALAGASGGFGSWSGRPLWTSVRFWLGVALIAVAGIGYHQWRTYQEIREVEEMDAAILSSDLPVDAYLDKGFQNWLRSDAK